MSSIRLTSKSHCGNSGTRFKPCSIAFALEQANDDRLHIHILDRLRGFKRSLPYFILEKAGRRRWHDGVSRACAIRQSGGPRGCGLGRAGNRAYTGDNS